MDVTLVYLPTAERCNAAELLPALSDYGITAEALRLQTSTAGALSAMSNGSGLGLRTLTVNPQGGQYLAHYFAAVYSRTSYVACIGGGIEPSITLLGNMLQRAQQGVDVVIASRYNRASSVRYPAKRLVVSRGYNVLVSMFLSLGTTDSRSGLKVFRHSTLVEGLSWSSPQRVAFDVQLLANIRRMGGDVSEVPVSTVYESSPYPLSLRDIHRGLLDTIRVFYHLRLSRRNR